MLTSSNASLSPSRKEMHYLWLGLAVLFGFGSILCIVYIYIVLLHQQPLLFGCLLLFVHLSYLCFCFIYYLN